MKILVVGDVFPWPRVSGGRMRLAETITALSALGDIDLIAFADPASAPFILSRETAIRRSLVVERSHGGRARWRTLVWLAKGRLPAKLDAMDPSDARRAFTSWTDGRYDLAWFKRLETYVALGPLIAASNRVVDLDDLEDVKARQRLDVSGPQPFSRVRHFPGLIDARRWEAIQRRVLDEVDRVVVCSQADRDRFGASAPVDIVPNGYELPGEPCGQIHVAGLPALLFHGNLCYGPNVDAARRLAVDVLPRIRALGCPAEVRVVGRAAPEIQDLGREPGVVVTGFVEDLETELRRAWLLAAPFRMGGGTRVKILEAFAHGIPVLTTAVGAHGLDVIDGVHAVIREDVDGLARACVALIQNPHRRRQITTAAHELWRTQYRWSVAHRAIQRVVRSVSVRESRSVSSDVA